jgi:hypothetical protein
MQPLYDLGSSSPNSRSAVRFARARRSCPKSLIAWTCVRMLPAVHPDELLDASAIRNQPRAAQQRTQRDSGGASRKTQNVSQVQASFVVVASGSRRAIFCYWFVNCIDIHDRNGQFLLNAKLWSSATPSFPILCSHTGSHGWAHW